MGGTKLQNEGERQVGERRGREGEGEGEEGVRQRERERERERQKQREGGWIRHFKFLVGKWREGRKFEWRRYSLLK